MTREMLEQLKKAMRNDLSLAVRLISCRGSEEFRTALKERDFVISGAECRDIFEAFRTMSEELGKATDGRNAAAGMLPQILDGYLRQKKGE